MILAKGSSRESNGLVGKLLVSGVTVETWVREFGEFIAEETESSLSIPVM